MLFYGYSLERYSQQGEKMGNRRIYTIVGIIFAIALASTITIGIVMQDITSENIPIAPIEFSIELDSNSIDIKKGESKTINMYITTSDKGLKGNIIIEPDYVDDMEIYKHLTVTADDYYIEIPASRGDNTLHTVQLRVSASNDAQEALYTYRVGVVSLDGKGSGAYLNITVLP
ncbi:hypothetical protein HRbin04_00919 [archaeon HR04]|nr:hypothetical protein HRbin04_00919 [archaeon HR04]